MSSSAAWQTPGKKEEATAFNPAGWPEENGGGDVPAGKLQVLEKFFTPVQQARRRKEMAYLPPQMESSDDRFSTRSSSSSTSTSSATWSLEARLEKEALGLGPSQYRSSPFGPGVREVAMEDAASHSSWEKRRLGGSFTPFVRGRSDLPLLRSHLQVGPAEDLEENFCKTTSLSGEEAGLPALPQVPQTGQPPLGRVVLRNGGAAEDGRLWKTRSSETVTGTRPLLAPKPRRGQQQEKLSSPQSLDLNFPKKPLILGENRRIEDKLRFSAFLNEVTQQIMSPSSLMSLGWKSRGSSPINRPPSPKSLSSESLLEKNEGKVVLPRGRRAEGDATSIRPSQLQANAKAVRRPEENGSSSESGLFAPCLASLPELSGEACGARRDGEGAPEHRLKAKAQEWSFKKAEEMLPLGAGKAEGKERSTARKSPMLYKVRGFWAKREAFFGPPGPRSPPPEEGEDP